jgi:hypothetical protein
MSNEISKLQLIVGLNLVYDVGPKTTAEIARLINIPRKTLVNHIKEIEELCIDTGNNVNAHTWIIKQEWYDLFEKALIKSYEGEEDAQIKIRITINDLVEEGICTKIWNPEMGEYRYKHAEAPI